MAFDEGKYDVAAAIAGFFKDRKDARDTYLNQPLVQVWDDKSGTMVYKRRSEAVGMSSEKKVNYADKLTDAVEILDDTYSELVGDTYEPIGDSDMFTNVLFKTEGRDMTQEEYVQSLGYFEKYAKQKHGAIETYGQTEDSDIGDVKELENKMFQNVNRVNDLLLNTKMNLRDAGMEYKNMLVSKGFFPDIESWEATAEGKEFMNQIQNSQLPDKLELFVVFGYKPNKDPKKDKESYNQAVRQRNLYNQNKEHITTIQEQFHKNKKNINGWP